VLFSDSLKRRRNARGKTIYEFAIFKCGRDHTWNKKLSMYQVNQKRPNRPSETGNKAYSNPKAIRLMAYYRDGYSIVEIRLARVEGKWRLDSLLSRFIADLSRTQIKRMVKNKHITVNGREVKAGVLIQAHHTICLSMHGIDKQMGSEK